LYVFIDENNLIYLIKLIYNNLDKERKIIKTK
jgi:hypothetical protein